MFTYLILAIFCCGVAAQNPCDASVYKKLDPQKRMVANKVQDAAHASCDKSLAAAWYRVVDGPAGNDMPTSCPAAFSCGTVTPVWLNGTLPQTMKEEKDMQACQRDPVLCCPESLTVRVKNCGDFNVYFLTGSLLTCDAAFCFGTLEPCKKDESSETGYEPGCSGNFPTFSGGVQVELYTQWLPTPSLLFRCAVPGLDTALFYDVDWFYNKEKIHSKSAVSGGDFKESDMNDTHWHEDGRRKMGFDVSCAIRARFNPGGTPSLWQRSELKFIGVKVLTPVIKIKEGETGEIHLQPTAPFPCDPSLAANLCTMKIGAISPEFDPECRADPQYAVPDDECKQTYNVSNWMKNITFAIKGKTDEKLLSWDVKNYITLATVPPLGKYHKTWIDYRLPSVKVTVVNNEDRSTHARCESLNDPHMKTFDGLRYEFHRTGEYILYQDVHVEVHARFTRCNNNIASCNSGIAVRSGKDLFAVDKFSGFRRQGDIVCGSRGDIRILSSQDGKRIEIYLRNGVSLNIWEENRYGDYFNVHVEVGRTQRGNTSGLCGTFDGSIRNDLSMNYASYWVQPAVSFFKQELTPWDSVRIGECKCNKSTEKGFMECDFAATSTRIQEMKVECLPPGYRDLTCHTRNKRDVMQEDYHGFDFDGFEEIPQTDLNPDLTWKGNWTEEKALEYCKKYIENGEFIRRCASELGIDTNSSVDICVKDIQLTGDGSWAQAALENMKTSCMAELNFDSKYWVSDNTSANSSLPLRDQMEAITCPEECNFRGDCVNGSCQCQAGYQGVSCAVDMSKGPDVTHIPRRGLCDVREKPCRMTSVLGDSFVDSANLTCRLSGFLVGETGVEEVGEVHEMPGVFESYAEVLCPAHSPRERRDTRSTMTSSGAHGYMISVANDGVLFGTPLPFVIFDSRCLDCLKSPDAITCHLKPDTCFIEGACYSPGESPYDKACVECRPDHSQRDWHIKEGTCLVEGRCFQDGAKNPRDPCYLCDSVFSRTLWKSNDECTDRKLWIIGAVLGSVLLLLVAVLLVWKFKVNRKQKVGNSMQDFNAVQASTKTA